MAQVRETSMTVYNLDLLADEDLAEDRERAEDGGKGGATVHDPVWKVVDFQAIGVGYNYYTVAAIDEFLEEQDMVSGYSTA
ncbi:hypothetical protein LTR32_007143 [Rachicladosporium monterosium]|uniref:Uncharacterized protein n=1 Tax=Rachicladosporium monterosium TaxID=1507873 RepID=A0ABR0KYC0_9PEZI|nr:hypothetical protein LTR32_007143 [Rachicladosporium monterosium]